MKTDWTAVIAIIAAFTALLPHLTKMITDRSAAGIAERKAQAELSVGLLGTAKSTIVDQSGEIERLRKELDRLQERVDGLERELVRHQRYLQANGLPPPPLDARAVAQ